VINLRGAVVPVIDLGARLGGALASVRPRSCIVIVDIPGDAGSQIVGMMVDGVNEVLSIPRDQIAPPPKFGMPIGTEFIEAMGRVENRFIILLDLSHVLLWQGAPAVGRGVA